MSKSHFLTVLSLLVLLGFVGGNAVAQSTNASVSGNVIDASRAAIPGVTITAANIRTGVAVQTISNEAGVYNFPSLQPGLYRISAELPGFQTASRDEVQIEISAKVAVNFTLQVAGIAQTVEVSTAADSPLSMTTSSVGGVISGVKIRDLPLPARNALDLITTQAGIVGDNFAGARIGTLNIMRDGINVMDQNINSGVNSVVYTSNDLIDEVRVVTSPADAELGRGSGQVVMSTRSGTNEFHGSLFESHRNTVLNANTWFNNQNRNPRNVLIRNQFGARLGGPLVKNRTFFHFLYEGHRQVTRNTTTSTTFTTAARNGLFRFYPGVRNGNVNAAVPTVDVNGNPVKPATATGDLQSISVFGLDPARMTPDPTGVVQKMIALMPPPNDFRSGDGLNTAGYTWSRTATSDRDQYNLRIDHNFNDKHRLNFSWTRESEFSLNGFLAQPYPDSPGGTSESPTSFYSMNLTSTLSSRVVNEFNAGAQRARFRFYAPWELESGKPAMPTVNGVMYLPDMALATEAINQGNDPQGRISPLYVYGDKVSWISGRHSFKVGAEMRFASRNGFNSFDSTPRANFGAGGIAVTGLTATAIPVLGTNEGVAQDLLIDLSGSLTSVNQALNASPGANPVFLPGEGKQRTTRRREVSLFFKDDFKVRPNLTLNLGVRYEWYGVPWEANGKAAGIVGGSAGLYGLSGTTFEDLYRPGHFAGSLTKVELVGRNSVNPKTKLHNNDWNNFAPAVGLSWSPPWFGRGKTVLRVGYGMGYELNSLRLLDVVMGDQPGLRSNVTFQRAEYLDLSRIALPLASNEKPLDVVPLTDRTQTVRGFDTNLRTPYVQNWSFAIQRELPGQMSLDVRYVGNKGTKLLRGANLNEANIFESGVLEAFLQTQRGENSALLDRMFRGLNLGLGTINGGTVTASASLRSNSNTRGFFANNNVGAFATYLNNTTNFTGTAGELLRRADLPENLIVGNPQFANSSLTSNYSNSTYHAMQLELNKRFSTGWTFQTNYTWSKSLGEDEGAGQEQRDDYRNMRDRRYEKRLLSFHRSHVFKNSGTFELPFGPNKFFLSGSSGFVARLIERWQFGAIINLQSGQPIGFTSQTTSFNQATDNTPIRVGDLPKNTGQVTYAANGIVYFQGLRQVPDPTIATLTTQQQLHTRSTMQAIADEQGRLIAVNPTPGVLGNLDPRYLQGPGEIQFDLNIVKRIRIGEGKEFEFRADAIGALNRPNFANPNLDINNTNFGRITSANGSRIIVLNARINF